jgi:uncharacterized protein YdaU (DUF1376 family)
MHFYNFNIGDYTSHTTGLSHLEDLAYRRLLDLYYLSERPFNGCSTDVQREINMRDYPAEVDYVLSKYFEEIDGCWVNIRADQEIAKYQKMRKTNSKAGKASAKARQSKAIEQPCNDRSTTVQPNKKQELRNKKQETVKPKDITDTNTKKFTPPTVEEIQEYSSLRLKPIDAEKFHDFYQSKGWLIGKNKMKDWKAAVRNWERSNKSTHQSTNGSISTRDTDIRDDLTNTDWAN